MKKFFIHTLLVLAAISFLSIDGISEDLFTSSEVIEETEVIPVEVPVEELSAEITDYEFYDLFSETLNNALSKISLMQNSGMKKLGEETQYGDISGAVHYSAKFNFWTRKATVVITFDNYCDTLVDDERIMVLDESITTLVNMSGDGQLTGTLYVSGFYPGYVDHNLEIISQDKSGGDYTVYQEGSESETLISWDYLLE